MLNYQIPESELTLSEGLREYYASYSDLVDGRAASDSARHFFACHDAAHVVFGCSTSLTNEAMVKIWSFCGTTGGFGLLRDYRSPESQEIYARISWNAILPTVLRALIVVPRVLYRCARMHKRWPWSDFESYMGCKLSELRREYGIHIVASS